ncbi:competence type IV pilus minor pilin ComGF [Lysinibacillus fusiformis]|uniref:competence type IV pilus minor pilin ComGF n=1 Tax=Lysinibacillus fusiformis TaxID=28031 RepID=UPI0011A6876F|nr:competence type IV pilus minor pilin ComGF [Lysinibacillus fusiformis]
MNNEKGYTLLEAMFQLIVFVLVSHLFVLIMLWYAEMTSTMQTDEQSKWELFVYDLNKGLRNILTFSVQDDHNRITFQTTESVHYIDCYRNIIREQVNGGHIPMLNGINKCRFTYSGNMLTVAVEMPSGMQKERTFYVPIIEK